MNETIDLSHHTIFGIDGIERVELDGEFSVNGLARTLVEEWIPYFECQKCGRGDYCKYTQPNRYNPEVLDDIKCGVAAEAIGNFVKYTFPLLLKMESKQRQNYLDGLFYFFKFIYRAEQAIGMCIDKNMVEYWDNFAPIVFGHITHLRDLLNSMASQLRDIPEFHTKKGVLFVEGWSEKAFIDTLRESHLICLTDIIVEVYQGKGNRKSSKVQMLFDKYHEQSYTIYIQGDADGNQHDIFMDLVQKCHIPKEQTFAFSHDFETAIPPELLFLALQELGEIEESLHDRFIQIVEPNTGSVLPLLYEEFTIELDPIKMDLAVTVGDILNRWDQWFGNKEFLKTELGKFLDFVCTVN